MDDPQPSPKGPLLDLWMLFNDYMAVGSILILPSRPLGEIFMGLKIESGPPEMEPWDERPNQPRAYGGLIR